MLGPDEAFRRATAQSAEVQNKLERLREDAGFHAALDEGVTGVNGRLADMECIGPVIVARDARTIETGYLTPSVKAKRHLVRDLYQEQSGGLK